MLPPPQQPLSSTSNTPFPSDPPSRTRGQTYTHSHPYDVRRPLDYSVEQPPRNDRQRHLQYLHSLMHVLLQRHPTLLTTEEKEQNAVRVGRIVRVLWSCKEWREGDLWREGLAWAGLDTSGEEQEEALHESESVRVADENTITERRIAFLKAVAYKRKGLRPLMLAHRAQELVALSRWREALDEIELVIQASPYRFSPELNLYAGLLVVLLESM